MGAHPGGTAQRGAFPARWSRVSAHEVSRGEIWLVDFGTPIGHEQGYRRPAMIVSADRMNTSKAGLVIVVPLTR
ncbi:MAG: type II toxin-antitoxin system PemK/MazF family toxin, partial [Actinomycetota bacterium]|nr:type II toxin-antitoxin system PemK/MazF family toxin [Actinomycetota bacterium]